MVVVPGIGIRGTIIARDTVGAQIRWAFRGLRGTSGNLVGTKTLGKSRTRGVCGSPWSIASVRVYVLNRQIDQDIIGALNTGTNNLGSAVPASLALVVRAKAHLALQDVDVTEEDNLFFVATPGFEAYLMQIPEFAAAQYVTVTPLTGPARRFRRWAGFNWVFHPHLPGAGTSSEQCFAFHRAAIGHAVNTGEMDVRAGFNEENAYYWARSSIFMGSSLLQNSGVLVVNHDGSKYT